MLEYLQILQEWSPAIMAATGVGTLLSAWAAVIFARKTLNETKKANNHARDAEIRANEQAIKDSVRQTRPYVFAELAPSVSGLATYDMVIRNLGRSMAKNVRIEFKPAPSELDDIGSKVLDDLQHPRDLPPHAGIRTYWRIEAPEGGTLSDSEGNVTKAPAGLPLSGTICVSYSGDDDSQPEYKETYVINGDKSGLWPVPESGTEVKGLTDREKAFRSTLIALTRHLGMLRW